MEITESRLKKLLAAGKIKGIQTPPKPRAKTPPAKSPQKARKIPVKSLPKTGAKTPAKKLPKATPKQHTFITQTLGNSGIEFVQELRFDTVRKFRFDWAIPSRKIAIEYEGIFSKKSRHTTLTGYSNDVTKYNLASLHGWRVLRYTAKNYLEFENDLKKILQPNAS